MVEIRVVRGGREVAVKVDEVLAGDLVLVDTGAKLPADGLLLRGSDFKANESAWVAVRACEGQGARES